MAQDFTLGKVGLATASGGDGLELACDNFEAEGDQVTCGGVISGDDSPDLRALVAQVRGYGPDNTDEPVIPVTWAVDPYVDGYYRMLNTKVSTEITGRLSASATGLAWRWAAELRRVPGWQSPKIEVAYSAALRTNSHTVVIGDTKPIIGIPGGADSYTADRAVSVGTQAVSTGNVLAIYPTSFSAAITAGIDYRCAAGSFYQAGVKVEYTADSGSTWRTVVGRQMPNDADAWRMTNDWVRVSNVSGNLRAEFHDGTSWESTDFVVGVGLNPSGATLLDDWVTSTVVRNSPEACSVSMAQPTGSYAGASVTLTLLRGQPIIYGFVTGPTSVGSQTYAIYRTASEAGASITGGIEANAADANGNKYFMMSPSAITKDTTTTSGIYLTAGAQSFPFAFGASTVASIGGSGIDQIEAYFAALTVRQMIAVR